MVRRLWALKILRLADGHHISPDIAVRERPAELADLDLWQGPLPEEIAQQAAAERRQAEQRRMAELDARREQERERRRVEHVAQREAAQDRKRREQFERERQQAEPEPKPEPKPK